MNIYEQVGLPSWSVLIQKSKKKLSEQQIELKNIDIQIQWIRSALKSVQGK